MASSVVHQRPRSAEQTARLLLSNAFRYDTWETNAARKEVQKQGGVATTVCITFAALDKQTAAASVPAIAHMDAVNIVLFDTAKMAFVGAAFRISRSQLSEPFVFQATSRQLLVLEVLQRGTSTSPSVLEEPRVTLWGTCPVSELGNSPLFELRPGNAHLLLLPSAAMWPAPSKPEAPRVCGLQYDCWANASASLAQLMAELVPPGVFVPDSFTKAVPGLGSRPFRLVVSHIELTGTTDKSGDELLNPQADWSVAAVAHNGYQQLGKGSEVPLVLKKVHRKGANRSSGAAAYDDSDSYSYSYSSSNSSRDEGRASTLVLTSDLPLEIDGLPVHSATSLVLAIRRRAPGAATFKVLGFCVFPLCMMPMKDRDVHVENLPALRGPFSCEDARLLMVDSATPYGRVPIAMTLTLEYHDTYVPASAQDQATPREAADGALVAQTTEGMEALFQAPGVPSVWQPEVALITQQGRQQPEQLQPPGAFDSSSHSAAASPAAATADHPEFRHRQPHHHGTPLTEGVAPTFAASKKQGEDSQGIFKFLCTIMEELHKVREAQDELLRRSTKNALQQQQAMSPGSVERINSKLADGPIDIVDLAPRPVSVSWAARREIQDKVQPILHPLTGARLDENVAAVGELPASLYGVRFEGITVDTSIALPESVCVLFSFGSLPHQQMGPMLATSVEKGDACESYKLYEEDPDTGTAGAAGFVWCEPVESLHSPAMMKFKEGGVSSVVYMHVYDALTMFYVATAKVPLAHFHRPYKAECGLGQMDLQLERDLSMTEQDTPSGVLPCITGAGKLHVTLFCVGVGRQYCGTSKTAKVRMPAAPGGSGGSRLVVAKKLPHAERLAAANGGESSQPPQRQPQTGSEGEASKGGDLHTLRAAYVKQMLIPQSRDTAGAINGLLPGVPDAHVREAGEAAQLEYQLRYLEKCREKAKSKSIAQALLSRITVTHDVLTVAWQPETVVTQLQNAYSVSMQFFVEVDTPDAEVCSVVGAASFTLGPRGFGEVTLVVRLTPRDVRGHCRSIDDSQTQSEQELGMGECDGKRKVRATVYSERREVVQRIEVYVTVAPPVVDRRYEVFGAAGTAVTKRILSRVFSSSSFPLGTGAAEQQSGVLGRMRDLCAYAATSHEGTTITTNAVIDPITQSHVAAWEEVTVSLTVPADATRQRTEYVTLFHDAAMTRVYETWELCVFSCSCVTTREIYWGQTSALGLPVGAAEEVYCSAKDASVAHVGSSFVLRLRPKEVGMQRMLLHSLEGDRLVKTLLTVPTVYPPPTFTQVVELSLADVTAPVFRRLTFINRGDREEVFTIHHNYRFQLRVNPMRFALAPQDSQNVALQFDMMTLPPGQMEGRWPMWIFINNADDKTIESYCVQVVLRAHHVLTTPPQ